METENNCPSCRGTGRCIACDGSGHLSERILLLQKKEEALIAKEAQIDQRIAVEGAKLGERKYQERAEQTFNLRLGILKGRLAEMFHIPERYDPRDIFVTSGPADKVVYPGIHNIKVDAT